MSVIENLLLNVSDGKDTKITKVKGNFLFDLIQTYNDKPEKLTDILKSLNVKEDDLDKLFSKNDNEELKNLIQNLKASLKKEPQNDLLKPSKNKNINELLLNIENNEQLKLTDNEKNILNLLINKSPLTNDELEKELKSLIKNKNFSQKNKVDNDKIDITLLTNLQTISNNNNKISTINKNKFE